MIHLYNIHNIFQADLDWRFALVVWSWWQDHFFIPAKCEKMSSKHAWKIHPPKDQLANMLEKTVPTNLRLFVPPQTKLWSKYVFCSIVKWHTVYIRNEHRLTRKNTRGVDKKKIASKTKSTISTGQTSGPRLETNGKVKRWQMLEKDLDFGVAGAWIVCLYWGHVCHK